MKKQLNVRVEEPVHEIVDSVQIATQRSKDDIVADAILNTYGEPDVSAKNRIAFARGEFSDISRGRHGQVTSTLKSKQR